MQPARVALLHDPAASTPSRLVIPLFLVGTFLYWFAMYVYVPILSVYAGHLGASLTLVGMVTAAYGLPQLILRIPTGVWSDQVGRRKPFVVAGLLIVAAGAGGFTSAGNPWALVAFRGVHGVAAAMWVAISVLFSSYFPPQRAVRAMGLVGFVSGLAQVLATWSGGHIAQQWGWLAPFFVSLALAGLGALCMLGVPDEPPRAAGRVSFGRLLRIGTVPLLLWVSIIAALSQFSTWGVSYGFLPVFAAQLGATRADQGNLMTAMLVAYTLANFASPFLAERWGERRIVVIGMLLMALPVFSMPWVSDLLLLGGLHAITGAGRGMAYPVLMGMSVKAVVQTERATAMGVFQAVYAFGMFMGPLLGGLMGDTLGLTGVFFFTATLSALGALLARLQLR